jgi:dihydrodipicolinate synthase/N-acetylneuraminate lyase
MPPLPEGLLVELVTPLMPTGTLDQGSLVRLLDRVAMSAKGVAAGCPGAGEALELPRSVRLELFTGLVANLPPHLPLFFGITGATPEETSSLALELEEKLKGQPTRRPVYWVDLPLWWHSNRGLPQTYLNLCRDLSHPLVLINYPHLIRGKSRPLKHVNLRTEVFKKLTANPGIVALIYRGEIRRFLNYYAAMAFRPEFMLYEGDERRFLTRPGARGLVSAGAQLFPTIWRQVAEACLFPEDAVDVGRSRSLIWEWSDLLLRLHDLYQLHPAAIVKLGLHHQGVLDFPAVWPATPSYPAHLGERFLEFLDEVKDILPKGEVHFLK